MSTIVEHLIGITKVGRRERPDAFLIISETSILRLLLWENMNNLGKAIKFVYWRESENGNSTYTLRAFIVHRLLGSIDKTEMETSMAEALRKSVELMNVLNRGAAPALNLDVIAERLLKRAEECEGATKAESQGLVENMFSPATV